MIKIIKKGLPFMLLAFINLFFCSVDALAAPVQPLTVYVTTVIDNAGEYPGQTGQMNSRYDAKRIYQMSKSNTYPAYYPSGYETAVFSVKNGATSTLTFNSKSSSASCNTVWFGANGYTDSHLSLVSVDYGENVSAYTYNGNGSASNPYKTKAITGSQSAAMLAKPASPCILGIILILMKPRRKKCRSRIIKK